MKKEELKAIGLSDEQADKVLVLNGKAIEKHKSAAETTKEQLATVTAQLTEANQQIETFKSMDIEGVKKAAEEWKSKAEQAKQEADAKMEAMRFDGLVTSAIGAAKGKNAKAIKALLDMDTLKASKNQAEDVKTALEAVKKDNDYLFEGSKPVPQFSSSTPGAPAAYMDAIRAAAGLTKKGN